MKLLNTLLAHETDESVRNFLAQFEAKINDQPHDGQVGIFPKVVESMRAQGILAEPPALDRAEAMAEPYDVTRKAISFPAPPQRAFASAGTGRCGRFADICV